MTKEIDYQPPGTVILTVEVGSTLYGVSAEDGVDDLDLISVVVEKPEYVTGLKRWNSHMARTAADGETSGPGDVDHTFYSLRKFVALACQGNPSILAGLFAPDTKVHSVLRLANVDPLQVMYPYIVSAQAIPRFRGYMRSQALRLTGEKGRGHGARAGWRPELVEKYGYDTKFAMHMVRLGLQGSELARTGKLHLPMKGLDRDITKSIRHGRWDVDEAIMFAVEMDKELERLQEAPPALNPEPNYFVVNNWLHETYLQTWKEYPS